MQNEDGFPNSTVAHPVFRGQNAWFDSDWPTPDRIMNQMFGRQLTGPFLHEPFSTVPYWMRPRTVGGEASGVSEVKNDAKHFAVNLDVSQFKPEEIQVKMSEKNELMIEGRHEERIDEHGFVSRHFKRRYQLPKECDMQKVDSHLSHDGILTITAAKVKAVEGPKERIIPIKAAPQKHIDKK